jgi:60 kDa SS-A/Ro ribonucleoprotein
MNFSSHINPKFTPQSEPLPGAAQVANEAGGYVWPVDDWVRLDRFLILGTDGGTYYASERKLTLDNVEAVKRCIAADGLRVVNRVVTISDQGRAPKNDPAILALAMAAKLGDTRTRRLAYAVLPKVCRIGTHLMHFAEYSHLFGGTGRGWREAIGRWYNARPALSLAMQLVKYQQRDGWSNRDLLRLAHPKASTPEHNALYRWATKGDLGPIAQDALGAIPDQALALVDGFERVKRETDIKTVARLVAQYELPRECVPTEALKSAEVWAALLPHMGMTAVLRNLATMTRVGLIAPLSDATNAIVRRLQDPASFKREHPIAILTALITYANGHGMRGNTTWTPEPAIVGALNNAFYLSFKNVTPTNKRTLLALDISGSMDSGTVAGVHGLTPRVAAAAMSLVTANVEPQHAFVAFTTTLSRLNIPPNMPIDQLVRGMQQLTMGGTDCAQPMLWARQNKIPVDTFVVYTDSETWAGNIHASVALKGYRAATGIPAKLVVVGMTSNGFTIADPSDAGMLDVVGFDSAAPALISDFSAAERGQ